MRFAKWVFRIAGLYGLLVIGAGYFAEASINRDYPPAITHREYYYGFLGVALAWQVAFLVISTDPIRYRPMMLAAVIEKISFVIPSGILWSRGELPPPIVAGASIDLILGVLFSVSYFRTVRQGRGDPKMDAP